MIRNAISDCFLGLIVLIETTMLHKINGFDESNRYVASASACIIVEGSNPSAILMAGIT